jgi:hypothetical protein
LWSADELRKRGFIEIRKDFAELLAIGAMRRKAAVEFPLGCANGNCAVPQAYLAKSGWMVFKGHRTTLSESALRRVVRSALV